MISCQEFGRLMTEVRKSGRVADRQLRELLDHFNVCHFCGNEVLNDGSWAEVTRLQRVADETDSVQNEEKGEGGSA
jgi:hypothetical protein